MGKLELRKARSGDEKALAYIQTESWKAAFADILPAEELERCTNIEKCEEMYKKVLSSPFFNVTIEFVDKKAHGIAGWSRNRSDLGENVAELICIHSLQDKWRKGYGSMMLHHILDEMRQAGYSEVVLWVFEKNLRARKFYEKHGFISSEQTKQPNGIREIMYLKKL